MLTAKVLNPNAALNSFKALESLEFVPGTSASLKMQLFDTGEALRFIPPSTAVLKVTFNKADGTTLQKTAALNVDDRSLATVSLAATETTDMIGGNILLTLDLAGDGTQLVQGLVFNALLRNTIDS